MPNWASNDLVIYGEEKDIDDFLNQTSKNEHDEYMLLDSHHPIPNDVDWYSWSIDNWGTKWPDQATRIVARNEALYMTFNTAWSPPVAGLRHISKLFPTLVFHLYYKEEGMGFAGYIVLKNEKVYSEQEGDLIPSASDSDYIQDLVDSILEEEGTVND